MENFVTALHRNPCAQVKFLFTAGCAGDTESSDIETNAIASVVFPLLILATFRAVLNQCAVPQHFVPAMSYPQQQLAHQIIGVGGAQSQNRWYAIAIPRAKKKEFPRLRSAIAEQIFKVEPETSGVFGLLCFYIRK